MGGFHVSGCLSMLDGRAVGLDACRDMGISMFAGEAEGRLEMLLQDAVAGRLAPLYDFIKDLPSIEGTPVPFLPKQYVGANAGVERELRCGPRLPLSVLVLHHHQRAGAQVALPLGRRRRASGTAQLGAGHPQVLHHRRQFCAQQGMGIDLRPPDRCCARETESRSAS